MRKEIISYTNANKNIDNFVSETQGQILPSNVIKDVRLRYIWLTLDNNLIRKAGNKIPIRSGLDKPLLL